MTTDRDVTRIVRSWLEDGVTSLPDRVLDDVLDRLPTTPQRRARRPAWRVQFVNTATRLAFAAAAVAVVVVAGASLLPRSGGSVGVPGVTASPSPAPTASPSPTASPTPSPSPIALGGADTRRALDAGTYRVAEPFALPFSITFASSFTLGSLRPGEVSFAKTMTDGGFGVNVHLIENVFADPCRASSGPISPPVPRTLEGLVAALTRMVGFEAGPVSDVLISGHPGKSFELTNTVDTATAACSGDRMLPLWTFRGGPPTGAGTNGGVSLLIWVIDVGGTPVVVAADGDQATLTANRLEIESIAQSMRFDP